MTDIAIGSPGWTDHHLDIYLKTDGAEGHYADFTVAGGPKDTPCLILKTKGRKSGEPKLLPLIYGEDGGNFIIVASKGGAPNHPAWYLNLDADPNVEFQVGAKKYRGKASSTTGAERKRLYDLMAKIYPPYIDYQARTDREIPVVVLKPEGEIDKL
jgi:deazaflavin-dependent oxidoreductase (nitroreductase family)